MVRIPSLSRRTEPAPDDTTGRTGEATATRDGAADGTARTARPVVTDRSDERTTYRGTGTPADTRDTDATRRAATARTPIADASQERTLDGRTVDLDRDAAAARADRDRDGVPDRAERPVVTGPKPRSSLLATLGLIAGVAGVLFVLTGALAGYGIGLGAVGAVLAVLGLVATRRRHVAGTTDALLGVAAGLGAVVLGVVAMTGQFDWPTTDGDWVARFREWLDSQFVDRF
ncbi:thrombospondin [Micromonospora thermarum]|uniref:thrombospondin n=1 Tax=Micromonospora thermarum TaxID=2720024 RepID=UPI001F0D9761|nr:thrombospondin [Micromonospora thermarum]